MAMAIGPLTGDIRAARRLNRLLDELPELVALWDADQRCVLANRSYVEWFGMTSEQIIGAHLRDVLGPRRYAEALVAVKAALAGREQQVERTVVDPSGHLLRSTATYLPCVEDGVVNGFFVVVQDNTTQSEMRRQLDDAQALARIGSYVYYPISGEVVWSAEMYRLIEADEQTDEPSLRLWQTRIHPDDREDAVATLDRCFAHGRPFELHVRLLLPSGNERRVKCLGEPVIDGEGSFIRMSGTVQDETEIHQVAAELEQSNERLEGANRLLSDTITTLGHDVRQPIQSAMGFLEFTLDAWDRLPDDQRRENVERSLHAALRMHGLVENILAFMNVESGMLTPRSADVRLEQELLPIIREVAPHALVAFPTEHTTTVRVDGFHLRLIVTNLLTNAERYGRPPLQVGITRADTTAQVVVSDCGEGVPEEFVPRIFDRFARAETGVAATLEGNGFGLYLARELARANGGDLAYRPNQPSGSSFVLTLPLVEPAG